MPRSTLMARVTRAGLIATTIIAATIVPRASRAAVAVQTARDSAARNVLVVADPHVDSLLTACLGRMRGVIPGSDSLVAWDVFHAHPHRTVDLILPTLRPVRRGLWLGAPNMVWRLRVLRRLTGLDYRAPTRARLSAEETRALAPDSTRGVPFASEDANLGMTWVAPTDAQKAIIARWRQWWSIDERKPELPRVARADDRTWWY